METNADVGRPESETSDFRVIGIQGGLGSFNHQAADTWLPQFGIDPKELHCFDSTGALFRALNTGDIDTGQFAIFNSSAGFYSESLEAVSQNVFHVIAYYKIPIVHCLIHHPDIQSNQVRKIITHKEVLKQCRKKLALEYAAVDVVIGADDLAEPASVAAAIAANRLSQEVATVSCGRLAKEYGLSIGHSGLQDIENNESTFLLVRR